MTILFLEDWQKYPLSFPDMQTSNKSFIRMAALLKSMGVENHMFILALHNPRLQGVDPYDPNLDVETMAAIAIECYNNFWYFLREVARAPADSGDAATPVEANRANISLFWSFFNHIMYILIQPRQTGKSFNTDILMRYLLDIRCRNTSINLMTKDDDLRVSNIKRLKAIVEEWPHYLQLKRKDDTNNTETITVNALGNRYNTHVPQASAKRALNMGRGLTTAIMHNDEAPFQANIALSLPAALAATGAAVDRAKASGSPYGTILTTTAGKKDDRDGKFVYQMLMEAAVWNENLYDSKNLAQLEERIKKASRGIEGGVVRLNGTFSHTQLGKTDEWLREKLTASLQKGGDANRDYFNIWTAGSQTSPLPIWLADKIKSNITSPLHNEISESNYITRWYLPEAHVEHILNTNSVVIGSDTSDASGGDDMSMVFVDTESLAVIGAGTYNETNLITFADWICQLLIKYPKLVMNIERKSSGVSIIDYLLLILPRHGVDPYKRIFNKVVHDSDLNTEKFDEIRGISVNSNKMSDSLIRNKKAFGYATTGSGEYSRDELFSKLVNSCRRASDRMHDKTLIDQVLALVQRNGRIDHEVGEHDDMVVGFLLANWFLDNGRNLAYYGIDSSKIGAKARQEATADPVDQYRREEQLQIRQDIEDTYKELIKEVDDFLIMRLEFRLKTLEKKLILEDNEVFNLDQLINKAKEYKYKNRTR